ncbi:xanthine dehydrogenase family protein molybdopterin-binding subunit [Bradyrhizobium erythrophlei]|uniref:Isoquinoline 1-oxidoreductase, beta subunit n=1 Tax=Bradyrhizobium erythrophlei TaxID=1437360 RepID=A0A1M5IQT8_9BRAD|nr:isoquinoline 1-oxidoreductase, beta subunit [Bradyrhizobium erythrophlei]
MESTVTTAAEVAVSSGLTRRSFLSQSIALGGGLVVPFIFPVTGSRAAVTENPASVTFEPNGFIRVTSEGKISVIIPYVEMGQGIYTALTMLIAEELDVPMPKVVVEHAPADEKLYANPILGTQTTGASLSVRVTWTPLRMAGATARTMLVSAAAATWKVPADSCCAENGDVSHPPSGRKLSYGALAAMAAIMPVPEKVSLKDPAQFKLIGKSIPRVDTVAKSTGVAVFGIDTQIPGLLVASVASSPVKGGRVVEVDDSKAKAVRGVTQIVVLDDVVAVVGEHTGATRKGLSLLDISWDASPQGEYSTETLTAELAAASKRKGVIATQKGDVAVSLAAAATRVDAVYQNPLLAHTTMEPMNCTVALHRDRCELWLGTQAATRVQSAAAKITGLPLEAVEVHNQFLGGGFGRRVEADVVEQAVRIAQKVDRPVKIIWSREEDVQHDFYRPYYYHVLSAGLDPSGRPLAWSHRVVGSSTTARWMPQFFKGGLDGDAVEGAYGPYTFPDVFIDYVRQESPAINTGWWRGVGPTRNTFVVEGFIDELASTAKQDPVRYRADLLAEHPRASVVLERAARLAKWGNPLPAGSGRGVALAFAFGSYVANVAEVSVTPTGDVTVKRIVCVADCGRAINPDTIVAQMQSGIVYGLSAALYGQITLKNGRVEQSNFHDYRALRIDEMPPLDISLVDSSEEPGGVGELAVPCVAPAVVNAIFAATGKRLRALPINSNDLKRT